VNETALAEFRFQHSIPNITVVIGQEGIFERRKSSFRPGIYCGPKYFLIKKQRSVPVNNYVLVTNVRLFLDVT